jgi:hypothetical protein
MFTSLYQHLQYYFNSQKCFCDEWNLLYDFNTWNKFEFNKKSENSLIFLVEYCKSLKAVMVPYMGKNNIKNTTSHNILWECIGNGCFTYYSFKMSAQRL